MSAVQQLHDQDSPAPYPSLDEFESGELDANAFVHAAHVYVAWQLLDQCTLIEAIQRFTAALRRLTKALDQEAKYHETMSWFFILLIAERRTNAAAMNWDEFAAANDDLISDSKAILRRYYSDARLGSTQARTQFLLPDRNGNA